MALWGTGAEELRPERWTGGEDGVAASQGNCEFPTLLKGPRGCIWSMFAEVNFARLLQATVGRLV